MSALCASRCDRETFKILTEILRSLRIQDGVDNRAEKIYRPIDIQSAVIFPGRQSIDAKNEAFLARIALTNGTPVIRFWEGETQSLATVALLPVRIRERSNGLKMRRRGFHKLVDGFRCLRPKTEEESARMGARITIQP
jgi:hypothetical protein